ncbi:hypothetical protein pb186bvf_018100 [Paramecium bursaria]
MGYFTLSFQNEEFEKLYQQHLKKCVQKSANYYMMILFIGQCFALLDQIISAQYFLFMLYGPFTTFEVYMIYLIHRQKIKVEYIKIYINLLSFTASTLQLGYYYFDFLNLSYSQNYVYMDIMHQFILLYNFGSSHFLSSIFFIYFLIIRVYIQISMGFTFLSLAFFIYGLFYITDMYQKEKQSRKQFLKGQRNKLFEQLIQEFIDDQICIIEKDEKNIQFIPIIINNKFKEFELDINTIIKEIIISQLKYSLYNYLYKINKNRETLLCNYKNQVYQITYWRIIQKKCQIFLKMQQVYSDKLTVVNYRDLYLKQQQEFYKKSTQIIENNISSSKQFNQLIKQVKPSQFLYCFQKYYCLYKCKFELITFKYLEQQLSKRQIDFKKLVMKPFHSDKSLLNVLLQVISQSMIEIQVKTTKRKSVLDFKFYGKIRINLIDKANLLINQILFHIGIGTCSIQNQLDGSCLIKMKLIDNKNQKFQRQSLK